MIIIFPDIYINRRYKFTRI